MEEVSFWGTHPIEAFLMFTDGFTIENWINIGKLALRVAAFILGGNSGL